MHQRISLVELTVVVVALHTPVQELLSYVEYLPAVIRHDLFCNLPKVRLRQMEMAWEAAAKFKVHVRRDGFNPLAGDKFLFDRETQQEWETRVAQWGYVPTLIENLEEAEGRRRNYRHVFWEDQFCSLIGRWNQPHLGNEDKLMKNHKLFVDVVEILKLHSHEVSKDNVEIILALRQLRRLAVHDIRQQEENLCWETWRRLVEQNCHLTELEFVGGRFSDSDIADIRTILAKTTSTVEERLDTCRIKTLDLFYVNIQPEGYRQLVALVVEMPQLLQLSITGSLMNFDTNLLIDAALRVPALQRLFLEHNELDDDAFVGLAQIQKPLALRHLRLINDNTVSFKTLETIRNASMDGVLNLERLELQSNAQIGDRGIHALTPMLASPAIESATVLTHLDVSNCYFGLEGVTNLLLALGQNKTVRYLNVSYNFFDAGFGDVLAEFLLTNSCMTHLQANGVWLELAGVSTRLLRALESNITLTSLSLGANHLENNGAAALLGALLKRAQLKPFALVDLSDNSISLSGLAMIADAFESVICANATKVDERIHVDVSWKKPWRVNSPHRSPHSTFPHSTTGNNSILIEELSLLKNNFNDFGVRGGDCARLIESIRRYVRHFKSNKTNT